MTTEATMCRVCDPHPCTCCYPSSVVANLGKCDRCPELRHHLVHAYKDIDTLRAQLKVAVEAMEQVTTHGKLKHSYCACALCLALALIAEIEKKGDA